MNLRHHIKCAKNYLDQANILVDEGNYIKAQKCVAAAYVHTRGLLNQVQKLTALKQLTERPAVEDHK